MWEYSAIYRFANLLEQKFVVVLHILEKFRTKLHKLSQKFTIGSTILIRLCQNGSLDMENEEIY